jgi:hypothetical protein
MSVSVSAVVASATHRQRKITLARGSNCRLDVLLGAAVDDGARHAADRLCPNRGRGSVAAVARSRNVTGQLPAEPAERSFNQISHFRLLVERRELGYSPRRAPRFGEKGMTDREDSCCLCRG